MGFSKLTFIAVSIGLLAVSGCSDKQSSDVQKTSGAAVKDSLNYASMKVSILTCT